MKGMTIDQLPNLRPEILLAYINIYDMVLHHSSHHSYN